MGSGSGASPDLGALSFQERRVRDAKDRDILRRTLEGAYKAPFFMEYGVSLVQEAEAALRNPSAQRFLVSVLSQRMRLENQRRKKAAQAQASSGASLMSRQSIKIAGQSSVSRLQSASFECLTRMCMAMLEACMESRDYMAAYQLLTHTAGFCTAVPATEAPLGHILGAGLGNGLTSSSSNDSEEKSEEQNQTIVYMTAKIGIHPIFADMRLWEGVLQLYLQSQLKDKKAGKDGGSKVAGSGERNEEENSKDSDYNGNHVNINGDADKNTDGDILDSDEYEAAVSVLYEMLGFGLPAEDLAMFALYVAEGKGWFATERGRQLLVLARRLSVKRDEGDGVDGVSRAVDIDLMTAAGVSISPSTVKMAAFASGDAKSDGNGHEKTGAGCIIDGHVEGARTRWDLVAWCHPTTERQTQSQSQVTGIGAGSSLMVRAQAQAPQASGNNSSFGYAPLTMTDQLANVQDSQNSNFNGDADTKKDVLDPIGYMGRTAVTSLASFGADVVASGGLDGSVFLAHTIQFGQKGPEREDGAGSYGRRNVSSGPIVHGVRLEWGNAGSRGIGVGSTSSAIDGQFGVGAVSCLAAARGAGYRHPASSSKSQNGGRGGDSTSHDSGVDVDDLLAAMEGCRVVAGTTGGDLRLWSVRDIYAATVAAALGPDADSSSVTDIISTSMTDNNFHHSGTGSTSSYLRSSAGSSSGSIGMGIAGQPGLGDSGPGSKIVGGGLRSSRTRFPLRGRALSGHRGGVTCIDVPSHIYRPESLVSGGADGLIKLWSLKQQGAPGQRVSRGPGGPGGVSLRQSHISSGLGSNIQGLPLSGEGGIGGGSGYRSRHSLGAEPLEVFTGHGGRVLTVKTAWHGDSLISGGADRTVRLWDLAGGGKCVHTLHGHLG